MTTMDRTELVEQSGCAPAFERTDAAAQDDCGRTAQEEVDVVFVASELDNLAFGIESNLPKSLVKKISPLVVKRAFSKLGATDNVHSRVVDTVTCCIKVKVPDALALILDTIEPLRSRCHQFSKPNGKSFRCGYCGHHDHRDAHAAFPLAERVSPIGGVAQESECLRSALLVEPFLGTEVQQCA